MMGASFSTAATAAAAAEEPGQWFGAHDELDTGSATLSTTPALLHLLREIERYYRCASHGGSASVRAHMRVMRTELRRLLAEPNAIPVHLPESSRRNDGEHGMPVEVHYSRALAGGLRDKCGDVVAYLADVTPLLAFKCGYPEGNVLAERLYERMGWAELVGPGGLVRSTDLSLGIVLIAPHTVYPQHCHDAVNESYVSLSGAFSQNCQGVFGPGSLVLNRAGTPHRLSSSSDPVLLMFGWEGGKGAAEVEYSRAFRFCRKRKEHTAAAARVR